MKPVFRVLLYNLAILVGCFVAMLVVPDNTPYLLFFGCCALAFVGMNFALFVVPRYRTMDRHKVVEHHSSRASGWYWWVMGAVFVLNLLLKYGDRLFRQK